MNIAMTYQLVCNKMNTMGATSGAQIAYTFIAPEFTPWFRSVRDARPLDVCAMFVGHCLSCSLFRLAIVLSVLRSTSSNYPFCIFNVSPPRRVSLKCLYQSMRVNCDAFVCYYILWYWIFVLLSIWFLVFQCSGLRSFFSFNMLSYCQFLFNLTLIIVKHLCYHMRYKIFTCSDGIMRALNSFKHIWHLYHLHNYSTLKTEKQIRGISLNALHKDEYST